MPGAFTYNTLPTNAQKGSAFAPIMSPIIPAGIIEMYAGSSAPDGWLLCDGSIVSRITYANLFKIIGVAYGSGNSNTTFALPDMRGRIPLGVGTGTGLTSRSLASTTGLETVTLIEANLPSHTHTATVGTESSTHTHSGTSANQSVDHQHAWNHYIGTSGSYGIFDSSTASSSGTPNTGGIQANHTHSTTTGTESANHNHTVTNANTGSGTAFNIIQPALTLNFIIKT